MMPDREKVIKGLECCLGANDCDVEPEEDCPYKGMRLCAMALRFDALAMLKEQEAVEPIKTCASANPLGVDGLLIVGNCPVCGQYSINNRDNKFCGGCGIPINWTNITERMRKLFPCTVCEDKGW